MVGDAVVMMQCDRIDGTHGRKNERSFSQDREINSHTIALSLTATWVGVEQRVRNILQARR